MFVGFKDIQSLPGPLGQVVDGTQNANPHNGGRTVVEEDKIKDAIRFMLTPYSVSTLSLLRQPTYPPTLFTA